MAAGGGRSLEETPTWAVAVVCFVLVAISIVIEHIIHVLGKVIHIYLHQHLIIKLERIDNCRMGSIFYINSLTIKANVCYEHSGWKRKAKMDYVKHLKRSNLVCKLYLLCLHSFFIWNLMLKVFILLVSRILRADAAGLHITTVNSRKGANI